MFMNSFFFNVVFCGFGNVGVLGVVLLVFCMFGLLVLCLWLV